MEIEINQLPQSNIEGKISLNQDELLAYTKEAEEILAKEKELNLKEIAPKKIEEQTLNLAVINSYLKAIQKEKLEVISQPVINILRFIPNKELIFSFKVSVLPKITLPKNYQEIAKEIFSSPERIEVEEKEIEDSLSWLRDSRAEIKEVKRGIDVGDLIDLDYEITDENEKKLAEEKNKRVILGREELFSPFQNDFLGLKAGQEKEFAFDSKEKPKKLKVKINKIYQRILPELNDDFARKVGNFKDLVDLRKSITEGIKMEKERILKEKREKDFLERVINQLEVELPEILWQKQKERILADLEIHLKKMNLTLKNYLEIIKQDQESFDKEIENQAKNFILRSLVVSQIAKEQGISAQREEIEDYVQKILSRFQYPLNEEKRREEMEKLYAYAKEVIISQKVFAFLENLAKITN